MHPLHVSKIIGADIELANLVLGPNMSPGARTGPVAAQLLLQEVEGVPAARAFAKSVYPSSPDASVAEWGRKFLAANGSSVYIDAHHLEVNTMETLGPADYVAAWRAMLKIAEEARREASSRLKAGLSLEVMANTSDRKSNSFGSHLSIATTRKAWTSLFNSARLLWLASFHVSSIVITGAGKVGAENNALAADFQLSERADFFGQLTTLDTTCPKRGIVNQRDEALTGGDYQRARYHCIFYDSNLQTAAAFLKAGMLSLVILMLEADEVGLDCAIEDPVAALAVISRDLTFQSKFATVSGKYLTALDVQEEFVERAGRFVNAGRCEGFLPDATRVIELWSDTLAMLRRCDLHGLSRRLDWALKLSLLTRLMEKRPGLGWSSRKFAMPICNMRISIPPRVCSGRTKPRAWWKIS